MKKMSDFLEHWDADIAWFLTQCSQDRRPLPSEFIRDAFADTVAFKLETRVYHGEPVLNARKEAYTEYKKGGELFNFRF